MNPFGDDDSWAKLQLEVAEPLQTSARTLGSDMLAAATAFKGQGKELPGELLARYVQWEEEFSNLRQAWDSEPRFSSYRPSERDEHSLNAWTSGFEKCINDIRERRERLAKDRDEKLKIIDQILALTCTAGPQTGLKDAQILAESLRLQLMDSSDRWEEVLKSPEHETIKTLWELILDARDGRVDEPESMQRSEVVAKKFGVHVAMQAYAGRYVSPG